MLQGEHSAILLTFIKLPFVIKTFVLSIFEWPFYTGLTVFLKFRTTPFYNLITQVNRMSRSRRVLATGGKQRILGLDMVRIETILFHLDSL